VQNSDAQRVVLVVDQFEDSFTLCQDKNERQAFFATLLGALEVTPAQLCLILAMRSDFVGKCFEDTYGGLAAKVKSYLEPVLPMTTEELTQAIEAPVQQTVALEPGLTEALLKDLEQSPGGLPLLQYTLTELWQRQQDNQLKLSVYHQLGGVTGTLQQRADDVFYNSLTPEQRLTAQHIFLSLTQLGEGAEDTRRRITQSSLVSVQHPEARVAEVVKQLADANLVVTDDQGEHTATVDVAHEVLIRNWPKLRQWLDKNRDLLRQQRKIDLAAAEWSRQPKKQQVGYLLQGRQLSDAKNFKQQHSNRFPLSQQGEAYLHQSLKHRRNNRLKLIGLGVIIPLGLAGYAGTQAATYFRLRPHWDLVYAYDAETNQIGQGPLVRALQEINGEKRSLRSITLSNADLRYAYLSHAVLSHAVLSHADLRYAFLNNAYLRDAFLADVDLTDADLRDANLSNAIFFAVDLRFAQNLTPDHLTPDQLTGETPPLLCNTPLPNEIDAELPDLKDRDCDRMAAVLREQYPYRFATLEEAQAYVDAVTEATNTETSE
jgi:uncharacterized protein YjbI with pentapeptide repeats